MATAEDITRFRRLINDLESPQDYANDDLDARLNAASSMNEAAYHIWTEKAASFSTMVNVSESGSSRNMGDLYRNAVAQAAFFKKAWDDERIPPAASSAPFTTPAVRG